MTARTITASSTVQAASELVSCELEGETVLLHMESGTYYGVTGTAAWIWQRIQEPFRVGRLVEDLQQEFEVGAEEAEADLVAVLDEMATAGLILVLDPAGGASPAADDVWC